MTKSRVLGRLAETPILPNAIKWADDCRLAAIVGESLEVHEPDFGRGGQWGSKTHHITCPLDKIIASLQLPPVQAEWRVTDIPAMLRSVVILNGGSMINNQSNGERFLSVDWSPIGCAWDGGCLLVAVTSRHNVVVYEPPRTPSSTDWPQSCSIARAMYEFLVPGGYAAAMKDYKPWAELNGAKYSLMILDGNAQIRGTNWRATANALATTAAAWSGSVKHEGAVRSVLLATVSTHLLVVWELSRRVDVSSSVALAKAPRARAVLHANDGAATAVAWPRHGSDGRHLPEDASGVIAVGTAKGVVLIYRVRRGEYGWQLEQMSRLAATDAPPVECMSFIPEASGHKGPVRSRAAAIAAHCGTGPLPLLAFNRAQRIVLCRGGEQLLEWVAHDHIVTTVVADPLMDRSRQQGAAAAAPPAAATTCGLYSTSTDGKCFRWLVPLDLDRRREERQEAAAAAAEAAAAAAAPAAGWSGESFDDAPASELVFTTGQQIYGCAPSPNGVLLATSDMVVGLDQNTRANQADRVRQKNHANITLTRTLPLPHLTSFCTDKLIADWAWYVHSEAATAARGGSVGATPPDVLKLATAAKGRLAAYEKELEERFERRRTAPSAGGATSSGLPVAESDVLWTGSTCDGELSLYGILLRASSATAAAAAAAALSAEVDDDENDFSDEEREDEFYASGASLQLAKALDIHSDNDSEGEAKRSAEKEAKAREAAQAAERERRRASVRDALLRAWWCQRLEALVALGGEFFASSSSRKGKGRAGGSGAATVYADADAAFTARDAARIANLMADVVDFWPLQTQGAWQPPLVPKARATALAKRARELVPRLFWVVPDDSAAAERVAADGAVDLCPYHANPVSFSPECPEKGVCTRQGKGHAASRCARTLVVLGEGQSLKCGLCGGAQIASRDLGGKEVKGDGPEAWAGMNVADEARCVHCNVLCGRL